MDHPATLASPRPWRAAALLAAGVATIELLLLVVIGLAWAANPFAGGETAVDEPRAAAAAAKPSASAAAAPTKAAAAASLPRSETSVIVFNGNGIPGAAGRAAGLVRSLDYLIAGTGNARRTDFRRSLVIYRPGYKGEALRLAQDLRVKRVAPLDGMSAAELEGAHVALIVGGP